MLVDSSEVGSAGEVVVTGTRADHLQHVLTVAPGAIVRVGIVDGPRGTGRVVSSATGAVTLHCAFEAAAPERPPIDLLLALPRPKVLRRLWAQLAALGVGRIILTNAARVERNYFDTHVVTPACFRPLLLEGLQQVRDTRLPVVTVHRRLKVLLEDELGALAGDAVRLVADPDDRVSMTKVVEAHGGERLLIAVGPEGGWTDFERQLFERLGFRRVGLGPRALRSDTACVALLALAHDAIARRHHGCLD